MNAADRAALDEMLIAGREDLNLARAALKYGDALQALRCVAAARCYVDAAKDIVRKLERKARR